MVKFKKCVVGDEYVVKTLISKKSIRPLRAYFEDKITVIATSEQENDVAEIIKTARNFNAR